MNFLMIVDKNIESLIKGTIAKAFVNPVIDLINNGLQGLLTDHF
ncbi:MAG: hypothetical protein ABI351_08420 [Herbaspirillum sp.]